MVNNSGITIILTSTIAVVFSLRCDADELKLKRPILKAVVSEIKIERPKTQTATLNEKNIVARVMRDGSLEEIPISKLCPDPILFSLHLDYVQLLKTSIEIGKLVPKQKHFDRCVRIGSLECLEVLLEHGLAPNDLEILQYQKTAILLGNSILAAYLAKKYGVLDLYSLAGLGMPSHLNDALNSIPQDRIDENIWNELLQLAAASGDLDSMKVLWKRKKDDSNSKTWLKNTLFYAVRSRSVESVAFLLKIGAKDAITAGAHPTHLACLLGDLAVIDALNAGGADWTKKDDLGRTCLHFTVLNGNPDLISRMLANGCDPNSQAVTDYRFPNIPFPEYMPGMAPLHVAAYLDNSIAVELLVNSGADINLKTNDQTESTPLHLAAHYFASESAQKLIELGANQQAKNKSGVSAIELLNAEKNKKTNNTRNEQEKGSNKKKAPGAVDFPRNLFPFVPPSYCYCVIVQTTWSMQIVHGESNKSPPVVLHPVRVFTAPVPGSTYLPISAVRSTVNTESAGNDAN